MTCDLLLMRLHRSVTDLELKGYEQLDDLIRAAQQLGPDDIMVTDGGQQALAIINGGSSESPFALSPADPPSPALAGSPLVAAHGGGGIGEPRLGINSVPCSPQPGQCPLSSRCRQPSESGAFFPSATSGFTERQCWDDSSATIGTRGFGRRSGRIEPFENITVAGSQ